MGLTVSQGEGGGEIRGGSTESEAWRRNIEEESGCESNYAPKQNLI